MTAVVPKAEQRWRDFWFERIPPHSYALYRIAIGVVGVLTILGAWEPAFWGLDGLTPTPGGGYGVRLWLAEHGLGTTAGLLLRWGLLATFTLLTLGVCSIASAWVAFLGTAVMLSWNWYPFSAAQFLLHNLTFYLIFVDPGAVWSWDASRRRRLGVTLSDTSEPIWPLRLLRYQVAIMYFAAGLWKLANPDWRAGTALHYVLNNYTFQRIPGEIPSWTFPATIALTYVTLAWELLFPFMLWFRPTRWLALVLGVVLHLGMWTTMEIGAFTPTVLAAYIAFLDPHRTEERVRRVTEKLRRRFSVTPAVADPTTASPSPSRRHSSAS